MFLNGYYDKQKHSLGIRLDFENKEHLKGLRLKNVFKRENNKGIFNDLSLDEVIVGGADNSKHEYIIKSVSKEIVPEHLMLSGEEGINIIVNIEQKQK